VPIGFEFPDPPQMFQKTHSMIFDFGLPTSATGLWVMTDLGTMNFSFYIVNGWDTIVDDNNQKTYGGRVGFMPSESFKMGVSYITGNETGNGAWEEAENLSVFDVDVTVFSESGSIIGFEYTRGVHEKNGLIKPGEDDARWNGLLFMTYLKLSDVSGITFRYDVFRDDDGARLPSGVKEKRQAYTISPSLVFGDGPSLRLEYRDVTSTESVFKGKKNMLEKREKVFGVEVFYNF
ncbi:MAG: outer membrane beta-barrel protein, partial [Nitrospinota bacterium]